MLWYKLVYTFELRPREPYGRTRKMRFWPQGYRTLYPLTHAYFREGSLSLSAILPKSAGELACILLIT